MSYRRLLFFLLIGCIYGDECDTHNRTDFIRLKSGECISCLSHCHYQSSVCLLASQLRRLCSSLLNPNRNLRECQQQIEPIDVHSFLLTNRHILSNDENTDEEEPVCLFCGNSTRGSRCEYCRQRPNAKQLSHLLELKSSTSTCFECSCSGQTHDCRTDIIDGCWCLSHLVDSNSVDINLFQCLSNRTHTRMQERRQCRSKLLQQCDTCKQGYNGVPSERGHRCYKVLATDTMQCFDYSNSIKQSSVNCGETLKSDSNRTILFEITPSYRNLNIRVLIGVEKGFADVICSIRNANFLVLNDHRVYFEQQSLTDDVPLIREYDAAHADFNFGILYSDPSDIVLIRNLSSFHRLTLLISPARIDFTQDILRCLLVDQPISRFRLPDLVSPLFLHSSFSLSDYRAIHLTTGSLSSWSRTRGYIKVYQSRMNIDLFVFFSVFFSSFFLFLSVGICFWKVKFAYEIYRRRRTLKHEYHKRVARPFAKIQLVFKSSSILSDENNSQQLVPPAASSSVDIPLLLPSTHTDIDYSPHLVAVEPLRDHTNCYTTLLFHLPGDLSTQYRLCAGTTLAQIPSDYANILANTRTESESQQRNNRRKRHNAQGGRRPKVVVKKTGGARQQQQQRRRKQQQQQPRTTLAS